MTWQVSREDSNQKSRTSGPEILRKRESEEKAGVARCTKWSIHGVKVSFTGMNSRFPGYLQTLILKVHLMLGIQRLSELTVFLYLWRRRRNHLMFSKDTQLQLTVGRVSCTLHLTPRPVCFFVVKEWRELFSTPFFFWRTQRSWAEWRANLHQADRDSASRNQPRHSEVSISLMLPLRYCSVVTIFR